MDYDCLALQVAQKIPRFILVAEFAAVRPRVSIAVNPIGVGDFSKVSWRTRCLQPEKALGFIYNH